MDPANTKLITGISTMCLHSQAAMQTNNCKGQEVYTNGSAGYMNNKDVTRMREVAFEKSSSEPLVYALFLFMCFM